MAKEQGGSLADESFNDDTSDWFSSKNKTSDNFTETDKIGNSGGQKTSKLISKSEKDIDNEFNDDDDDGEATSLEDKGNKKKGQPAKAGKKHVEDEDDDDFDNDDEKDEEDEEDEDSPKNKKKEPAKKTKQTTKEEEEDEDEGEDEEDNETDEEKEVKFYTTLAKEAVERGFLTNVKIAKGEKITEERYWELKEEEMESRVAETITAISERLKDDGKRFLKLIMEGGDPSKYIASVTNSLHVEELDLKDASQVDKVVRHHLKVIQKLDEEEVEDQLKYLKEQGTINNKAEKYFAAIKKLEKEERDALVASVEANNKAKDREAKEFRAEFNEVLGKVDKVGSFPISKTDKRELDPYINRPVVKVGTDKYIPQLTADLNKILRGEKDIDKKYLIALAKIVKSRFKVGDVEVEAQTRVTKRAQSALMAARNGSPRSSTSGAYGRKAVADWFAEE